MATWIDFRELRKRLDFKEVLNAYGVDFKLRGDQARGVCPLPTHQSSEGKPTLSVNLARGLWRCFGCQIGGNALDFCVRMEGLDPSNRADVRQTALLLAERFKIRDLGTPPIRAVPRSLQVAKDPNPSEAASTKDLPRVVNAPLDFKLKGLDPEHPYLTQRRLEPATIAHFGLGYCSRGILAGRIAIPLHNTAGQLVGYAGRLVDDKAVDDDHPKYRFPGERERQGKLYEFKKSLLVYGVHQITKPVDDLIVVEGFTSVWWLWQTGYRTVVALMGASCSREQARIIAGLVEPQGRVWATPDGNKAGEDCSLSIFAHIGEHRFVRWVRLVNDKQPTDLSPHDLALAMGPAPKGGGA